MDSSKKFDKPSPEERASVISRLFFCWVLPFLKYGYKNGLQLKDMFNTTKDNRSGPLGDDFERHWNEEILRAGAQKRKPSLKRAIWRTYGLSYAIYGIYLFVQVVILRSVQPLILAQYIQYFEDSATKSDTTPIGWSLGSSLILVSVLNVIIQHGCNIGCRRIGMRIRVACSSLVYRKLLKLNQESLSQTAGGQIVNLLSNDVLRFDIASNFFHYLWLMPIQCALGIYIMYRNVGAAAFAGMAFMIFEAIPLQGYLSRLQGKLRSQIAEKTDYRVKLMSEIIAGIQVIKMYAWEKSFEKVVEKARKMEIDKISQASYLKGLYLGLTVFTERLCLYLTIITFVLMGNTLRSDVVFSTAQLFNTIQLYMAIYYVTALSTYEEAKVSIKRLENFLLLDENQLKLLSSGTELLKDKEEVVGYIKMKSLNATWLPNLIADTLMDINLEIKPGTLCCVIGSVGSGKSSLLQTILKELPVTNGRLEVHGKIAYASQEPWLFVSSVRNNILFGQSYDRPRYKSVVRVCALEPDFKRFPYQDKTLVGERGVSLSGGQRARVNLARAVYSEADIYLLDDPLSAVDTHVGKHLFEECIVKYLKGKTRILVTHQLQFLKNADLIVIMNNGNFEKVGTYDQLNENDLKILQSFDANDEKESDNEYGLLKKDKAKSIASFASSLMTLDEEPQETQELIEKGVIPTSTYTEYLKNGASIPLLIFTGLSLFIVHLMSNAADLWVTHWTNIEEERINIFGSSRIIHSFNESNRSMSLTEIENYTELSTSTPETFIDSITDDYFILSKYFYIIIYSFFIGLSIIFTPLSRNLCFYIFMKASRVLHKRMFNNILQAPMKFFDENPSGRILNRFSNDMGIVDETLPKAALEAIQVMLVMCGILLLVFLKSPWMMLPAVLLGLAFYVFEVIYLTSAQDLKRLEGVTKAPVFSHISATLGGLSTIRASNAERMIINEFDILQDQHSSTWYLSLVCSEAFGFYLDAISLMFLSCVTFQFMIFGDESTLSGNVGLVISQAMVLTGMLQLGPRATAEVASNMTCVERVLQYSNLEKEGPFETLPSKKPPRNWPEIGRLTFKNMYLSYNANEAPVLRNLNFEIQPGEKVGIVGRTGAGKSSLIASLFRLAPIEGTILIDGIDTSEVGLNDLRSKISIIPQEPILFSNTVRYNLDPFGKSNDETLWESLEKVELKGAIENLDQMVNEGGSNFSAGQRQLICLARAIVRNNKVLVMDEATANVDQTTDNLIQKTIRVNFKDCTVLTIAHRLNTIMDSDKVLVMEAGEAVEFDHPHILLQNTNGIFSKMVHEVGTNLETSLRKIANEDYMQKFGNS